MPDTRYASGSGRRSNRPPAPCQLTVDLLVDGRRRGWLTMSSRGSVLVNVPSTRPTGGGATGPPAPPARTVIEASTPVCRRPFLHALLPFRDAGGPLSFSTGLSRSICLFFPRVQRQRAGPRAINQTTDAINVFAPIWRHKWLILIVAVLVSAGAYLHYKSAPTVFRRENPAVPGGGQRKPDPPQQHTRQAEPRPDLPGQPGGADRFDDRRTGSQEIGTRSQHRRREGEGQKQRARFASTDFIQISAEARTPLATAQVANAYAEAYITRATIAFLPHDADAENATTRAQIARINASIEAAAKISKRKGSADTASTLQVTALKIRNEQPLIRSRALGACGRSASRAPGARGTAPGRSRKKTASSVSSSASSSRRWPFTWRAASTAGCARCRTSSRSSACQILAALPNNARPDGPPATAWSAPRSKLQASRYAPVAHDAGDSVLR